MLSFLGGVEAWVSKWLPAEPHSKLCNYNKNRGSVNSREPTGGSEQHRRP